jgi:hypothetical protein
MKFLFEPIPSISLSNLCEMFDDLYFPDASGSLTVQLMMDISQDVLDITVDGMHCGTLVGAQWFLEQMTYDNVAWCAHENDDYDRNKWIESWTAIYNAFMEDYDQEAFYCVRLDD